MISLLPALNLTLGVWLLLRGIVLPNLSDRWRGPSALAARNVSVKMLVDLERAALTCSIVLTIVYISIGAGRLFHSSAPIEGLLDLVETSQPSIERLQASLSWSWIFYLLFVTAFVCFDRYAAQGDAAGFRSSLAHQLGEFLASRGFHSSLTAIRSTLSVVCSALFIFSLIGFGGTALKQETDWERYNLKI